MHRTKQQLAIALAVAMGVGGAGLAQAAQLTLNFGNNAAPGANPLFGGIVFATNTEFRLLTPYGSNTNDGQKDAMFGGESWTFSGSSLVGALMTGVAGTDTNVGATTNAPITSGLAGFPVCAAVGTCVSLQQNTPFLGLPLSVVAPVAGSAPGNAYGEAIVQKFSPGDAGNDIEIFFPVVHYQFADGNYLMGSDPVRTGSGSPDGSFTKGAGPGLLFFGEVNGSNGFTLWGQSELDGVRSEGPIIGLSQDSILQWELVGTYSASAVPIPASLWLFGSGVAGLTALTRRRRRSA